MASTARETVLRSGRTVTQGGRAKAYRPVPAVARRAALAAAVAAWHRGDWFEAHELLEPAWMGTDDALERDLYQGLIKLAAAYVHSARHNRLGLSRNLAGACDRLARVADVHATQEGVDVAALLAEIRRRLPADGGPADLDQSPPLLQLMEVP